MYEMTNSSDTKNIFVTLIIGVIIIDYICIL